MKTPLAFVYAKVMVLGMLAGTLWQAVESEFFREPFAPLVHSYGVLWMLGFGVFWVVCWIVFPSKWWFGDNE